MSKIKIAAAFFEASTKLTAASAKMTKAMLAQDGAAIDAAIVLLQQAVDAFKEARKIETP